MSLATMIGARTVESRSTSAPVSPPGKMMRRRSLRGGKRGKSDLAGSLGGTRKGDSLGGLVFYWLVKHVHQEPDETVLPTDDEMLDPVMVELRQYFERIWDGR